MTNNESKLRKEILKILPKKKRFSVNTRLKYGGDYINKIVWQNQTLSDSADKLTELVASENEIMNILNNQSALPFSYAHDFAQALRKEFVILKRRKV